MQIRWAFGVSALLIWGASLLLVPSTTYAQSNDDLLPLRATLDAIEATSPYRFSYRDALIANKRVRFQVSAESQDAATMLQALERSLATLGLRLYIDHARYQVLVLEADDPRLATSTTITGVVVDNESGARLPYATVTWTDKQDALRGTISDANGHFRLTLPDVITRTVRISYVGYATQEIKIDPTRVATLAIRLVPSEVAGPEVVISGPLLRSSLDTSWHDLLRPGLASSFGEGSVIRSLMTLPAVSFTPALGQGLNVRGSRTDGFQVLLDGITMYNQHHFFGLFDAFNEDVLQTVGLYYGVTPAHYQAPPGGTLAFITKSGSQRQVKAQTGLSNAAFRGSLEGPLAGGRGSWLLAGRRSYLDAVDWFNNQELIAAGLNVRRETSIIAAIPGGGRRVYALGDGRAVFFDLHGKLLYESEAGNRTTMTAYLGGDFTEQEATINLLRDDMVIQQQPATTTNEWGNGAIGIQHTRSWSDAVLGQTLIAFSQYYSNYLKRDFLYLTTANSGLPNSAGTPQPLLTSFEHDNALHDIKLEQQVDWLASSGVALNAGATFHQYQVRYEEASLYRTFGRTLNSYLAEGFAQVTADLHPRVHIQSGLRAQYYQLGQFLRFSPRLSLSADPSLALRVHAGYSYNHQFLHRLYLPNSNSADIWILSTESEAPGAVHHMTTGFQLKNTNRHLFQVDGYLKYFSNLRQHETTIAVRQQAGSVLLRPWLHDSDGFARGLEFLHRFNFGPLQLTQQYSLTKMTVQHPTINDGDPFRADYDRRHQFASHADYTIAPGWRVWLSWMYASGAPNTLALIDPREEPELDLYHRLDVSTTYTRAVGHWRVKTTFSVFNLYGRQNTSYRDPVLLLNPTGPTGTRRIVNVDVYDLGLQPSFSIQISR